MTVTLTPEAELEVQAESDRLGVTPETVAIRALIDGLRAKPVPQSVADLPRRELPPGKTLEDLFRDFWRDNPSSETDEEVLAALESLS